jgi:hypothetical protein
MNGPDSYKGPEGDDLDKINPFDEGIEKKPRRHYLFNNIDLPDRPKIFDCYVEVGTKTDKEMEDEAKTEYRNTVGVERNSDYIGISVVLE